MQTSRSKDSWQIKVNMLAREFEYVRPNVFLSQGLTFQDKIRGLSISRQDFGKSSRGSDSTRLKNSADKPSTFSLPSDDAMARENVWELETCNRKLA